jgi:PPOX class probable F420-dependent enzyme
MTPEELDDFLAKPNNAIVGTAQRDGRHQLTPVWFVWDGEAFLLTTTRGRAKNANLRRDPFLSLIVDDPVGRDFVVAYGQAEIIEEYVPELVQRIIEKYVPGDQRAQRWQTMPQEPDRVAVVLRPEKMHSRYSPNLIAADAGGTTSEPTA